MNSELKGLARIQEALRLLSNAYRKALPHYFGAMIKISVKHARKEGGEPSTTNYLSDAFEDKKWKSTLKKLNFDIDLRKARAFSNYEDLFIYDVGVQIVDSESSTSSQVAGPYNEDRRPTDGWDIELKGFGVPLDEPANSAVYRVPDLIYASVPGDNEGNKVRMSHNPRIQGVNPKRKWKVAVHDRSTFAHHASENFGIYDIILHFNVIARVKS